MGDKVKTTKKPCPVCGQTWSRDAGKPCEGCQDWIARMRRLDESRKEEHEAIGVPWAPHEFAYIEHAGRNERDAFCESLWNLVMAATTEGPTHFQVGMKVLSSRSSNHYSSPTPRYARKGLAEAVDAVHEAVKAMVRSAHEAGHAKGRNLLTGLASGDLTVKEFNDASREAH